MNTISTNKGYSIKPQIYHSIDDLRAYAAIGIILMHVIANISTKPTDNYITTILIPFFTDFTLLFMIVSGFSLCCGYYQKFKEGSITPNTFYKKRYLRILPFFALLCILNLILEPSIDNLYQVYSNLTLCFSLLPNHNIEIIGVGWFLGVVFLFYLLYPFFVFMIDNKKRAWFSFIITLVFVFIIMDASFVFGGFARNNIIYDMPFFLSGGIIYLYKDNIERILKKHSFLVSIIVTIITLLYILFLNLINHGIWHYITELVIFSIWLIYAVGISNCWFLNNKITKYISKISMEIYLAHMVIYRIIEKFHLENYIHQNDVLYIITSLLTIGGVICFAHVIKFHIINRFEKHIRFE